MIKMKYPTKAIAMKILTTVGICVYPDQPPDFADHSLGYKIIEDELNNKSAGLTEQQFAVLCNDILQEAIKIIVLKESGQLTTEHLEEMKYYPLQSLSENDIHSIAIFGELSADLNEIEKNLLLNYKDVLKNIKSYLKDKKV